MLWQPSPFSLIWSEIKIHYIIIWLNHNIIPQFFSKHYTKAEKYSFAKEDGVKTDDLTVQNIYYEPYNSSQEGNTFGIIKFFSMYELNLKHCQVWAHCCYINPIKMI